MNDYPVSYAEDLPYWDTIVTLGSSQGDVLEELEKFGASQTQVTQGSSSDGRFAWLVRFSWRKKSYRFVFTPAICREPERTFSRKGQAITRKYQARLQMGRTAFNFVKAILIAAAVTPDALFGFLELVDFTTEDGMPATAAEINVDRLTKALPEIRIRPMLGSGDASDNH